MQKDSSHPFLGLFVIIFDTFSPVLFFFFLSEETVLELIGTHADALVQIIADVARKGL